MRFLRVLGEHIVDGPAWVALGDSGLLYPELMLRQNKPGADPLTAMTVYGPEDVPPRSRVLRRAVWNYISDARRLEQSPEEWPAIEVQYFLVSAELWSGVQEAVENLNTALLHLNQGGARDPSQLASEVGFRRVVNKWIDELRLEVNYDELLHPELDRAWLVAWEAVDHLRATASTTDGLETGFDVEPDALRRALTFGDTIP
jgi:hypothetical protein